MNINVSLFLKPINSLILILLCLNINPVDAGEIPDTLYQLKLGDSINDIKGTRKAGHMSGLYQVPFDEKKLDEPPNKHLIVTVHDNNSRIKVISGVSVMDKVSCPIEAKRLKEKYENRYKIKLEESASNKNYYILHANKKYFIIGCLLERKEMLLRVVLADDSDTYKKLTEHIKLDVLVVDKSLRKLLSAWSTDCSNQKKGLSFVLESYEKNKFTISLCSGFKCILYPGFKEPFDVYKDKRIEWISETTMNVINKPLWKGSKTFHRCLKY